MSARDLLRQCTRVGSALLPVATAGGALAGLAWIARAEDAAHAYAALVAAVPDRLAPLAAGVLVAVRGGASFAGELAALRAGQQLDWIAAAGLSRGRVLYAPRVLAAVLVLPVLAIVTAAAALTVAALLAAPAGGLGAAFVALVPTAVGLGLAKAACFGGVAAAVACAIGAATPRGESPGRAAGRGAVAALFAVVALDLALAASRSA